MLLKKTIQPFIDYGFTNFYFSCLNSINTSSVESFMKLKNLKYSLYKGESIEKNNSFDICKILFKNIEYFLFIDIGNIIVNSLKLLKFCNDYDGEEKSFFIKIKYGDESYRKILFKRQYNFQIEDNIYDRPDSQIFLKLDSDIFINSDRYDFFIDFTVPSEINDKNVFTAGIFHLNKKNYNLAISYLNTHLENGDNSDEEKFISLFYVGRCYNFLFHISNNEKNRRENYNKAIEYYDRAFKFRRTRIEPIINMINIIFNNDHKINLIKMIKDIPIPEDILFVSPNKYNIDIYNLISNLYRTQNYNNKTYIEGYNSSLKLIPHLGFCKNVCENLDFYEKRLIENNSEIPTIKNKKILNLILYSDGEEFNAMYTQLTKYLERMNIEHYFYAFNPNIEEEVIFEDNIVYFKGEETFLPGILHKTLLAFEYFKDYEYDFIIRTNMSTIINYEIFQKMINFNEFDFSCNLLYEKTELDIKSGLTENKTEIFNHYPFLTGMCLILNKKTINAICENKELIQSYGLIDDVSLGVFIYSKFDYFKIGVMNFYHYLNHGNFKNSLSWNTDLKAIIYRNKSKNRLDDIKRMERIIGGFF